ncbi:MAG TPA: DUF4255 domain-containing protein [Kaistia sp.]|nr:DUF4255 domain-containing protein [Kaistia sp.]
MSSPLAIGAVSAVLRNLLDNGLIEAGNAMGVTVDVSAVAPDTIDLEDNEAGPRLNLFLYQVTPNPGWRNVGLPSRSAVTGERLTNAPLALDLHYLLTAYARADFQAEILLGYAMHLLHERPVLDREAIRRALDPSPLDVSMLPPAFQALVASDLADQLEQIKLTPSVTTTDDMSKIWSAIQSHYRPSAAYQASVVLIEGTRSGVSPLPVLSRGLRDPVTQRERGVVVNPDLLPSVPTLIRAEPQLGQSGARLGEPVTVSGARLAGAGHRLLLRHRLNDTPFELAPDSVAANGMSLVFTLPDDAPAQAALVAGQISIGLRLQPAGEPAPRETNSIPLVLAPTADFAGATLQRTADAVTVELGAVPEVRPQQKTVLIIGTTEAVAGPRQLPSDPLEFSFSPELAAGAQPARLRVDGADSIFLDLAGPTPIFAADQSLVVP